MVASKKNLHWVSSVVTPAKITAPVLSEVYPRTRLFNELDRALKKPIAWIAAPGGAGKTTLVASYLRERRLSSLWYQMDVGDNDVASFFYYLGLAAKAHSPRCRLPLLTPEYLAGLSAFTANFFRTLFASIGRGVLVLDNYQDVDAAGKIREILEQGLNEIPAGVNVIVLSREEPSGPMARLRASQQLTLLGWDDLRLTEEESDEIVRLRKPTLLPADAIRALHRKTEGWVAGLVLLTERRGTAETEVKIDSVGNQTVFDYFASQVFNQVNHTTQSLLLQTAFIPRLPAKVVRVLAADADAGSGDIFEHMVRRNLFVVRRPDDSFEYHPLFRAFLLACAEKRLTLEQIRASKRRSAYLLAESGQHEMAVELLLDAAEWPAAAELIAKCASTLLSQGRHQTFEMWLGRLQQSVVSENPWVLYWSGICRLPFAPAQARHYFEQAFELFEKQTDATPLYRAWSGIIESFVIEWKDFVPMVPWLDRYSTFAIGRTPAPHDVETDSVFTYLSGLIHAAEDSPQVTDVVQRAEALWERDMDAKRRFANASPLINYYIWAGNMPRLAGILENLAGHFRSSDVTPLMKLAWYARKALYEGGIGSPEEAIRLVHEGLAFANSTGVHLWDIRLLGAGILACLSMGKINEASCLLERMLPFTRHGSIATAYYNHNVSLVAIHKGHLALAVEMGRQSVEIFKKTGILSTVSGAMLNYAYACALNGDTDLALKIIEEARQIARRVGSKIYQYHCDWDEACVYRLRGDSERTLIALRKALEAGERMGILYPAWCRRDDAAALYLLALELNFHAQHVHAIIRRVRLPVPSACASEAWPWIVKIYTLGRFSLNKDGSPRSFSGKIQKKPLELLHALIACRGASADKLIETLWPDMGADMVRSTFRSTLMRLRRMIGEEAVLFEEGRVTLNPACCWVDAWAIEQMSEDVIEPATALKRADQLLALYKGPFLAEDETPLVLLQRERLRSKFLRMIARFGEKLETNGDCVAAIPLYEKAIEIDPLAEELCRRLMRCYTRAARFAEALSLYERCRVALGSVLQVGPSAETEALHREIRRALPASGMV